MEPLDHAHQHHNQGANVKRANDFKTNPHMPIVAPRQAPQPAIIAADEPSIKTVALTAVWQTISRRTIAILFLLLGVSVGIYYAWMINPVEWTGMSYEHLSPADKVLLVEIASDLNAYDPTHAAVIDLRGRWGELDGLACFVATQTADPAEKDRLNYMAYRINGRGCE